MHIGPQEAKAYLRLLDNLFGARFFSGRRLASVIAVVLVAEVVGLTWNLIDYPLHERDSPPWVFYWFDRRYSATQLLGIMFPWDTFGELIFSSLAFAISVSITRFFAAMVARIKFASWWVGPPLLIVQLLLCFLLFRIWMVLENGVLTIGRSLLRDGEISWNNTWSSFGYGWMILFDDARRLLKSPAELLLTLEPPFVACERWSGSDYVTQFASCAVSHLGSGIRLFAALVFVGAWIINLLLVRLLKVAWARLVENEKPIFVQLFSALGVIVAIYSKYFS
jgi:hypothetical protein